MYQCLTSGTMSMHKGVPVMIKLLLMQLPQSGFQSFMGPAHLAIPQYVPQSYSAGNILLSSAIRHHYLVGQSCQTPDNLILDCATKYWTYHKDSIRNMAEEQDGTDLQRKI